jgi:xanthine dehydrogenase small subunit
VAKATAAPAPWCWANCARVGGRGSNLTYRAINSCIRLAHSIDGMALWTAVDLTSPLITYRRRAQQHPAQEALVQCHGSQCGFCTPGFVMSLFGMYQNQGCHGAPSPATTRRQDLSGNLCRCTGYRPILDAAQSDGFGCPVQRVNEAELLTKLEHLKTHSPRWARADFDPDSIS